MTTLAEDFINKINQNFGEPFLPDGFVKAKMSVVGDSVILRIGRRDIEFRFDLNSIQMIGSGSAVGDAVEWVKVLCTKEEFR